MIAANGLRALSSASRTDPSDRTWKNVHRRSPSHRQALRKYLTRDRRARAEWRSVPAVKGLADMNNNQKAMIHNIEAITERVREKIGGELTPAQRKEIASSVVSKYLTSIQSMVAQHLCIPRVRHRRMATALVTTVAKQ